MTVQTWKEGSSGEPKFPTDFEVIKKAVLQVTDIVTNRNKYYAIELHKAKKKYRVYTHYGRTDDLDSNPNAGMRETRYVDSLGEAENLYDKIYKEKTSARKGYKELSLASSKIGSHKSFGKSSGTIDDKTLKKMAAKATAPVQTTTIIVPPPVQELVANLYSEATKALTKVANVSITANGIETPLGVLTIGQIDKGEDILQEIATLVGKKNKSDIITSWSGDFYTVIPHKIGRNKSDAMESIIDTAAKITQKQETLQLMRDMLNVNGKTNVLIDPKIEKKYSALNCSIGIVDKNSPKFKEMKAWINKSKVNKWQDIKIRNIYTLRREDEFKAFKDVGNKKLLFHGSHAQNWVGILSRGLLLPKIVTKLGVSRTDGGWLGNGIYFGDAICTSMNYACSGKRNCSYIAIANVSLGKMKEYKEITYGLDAAPKGYNSCHGNPKGNSEFDDDEFVIYNHNQQRLEYLIELED